MKIAPVFCTEECNAGLTPRNDPRTAVFNSQHDFLTRICRPSVERRGIPVRCSL